MLYTEKTSNGKIKAVWVVNGDGWVGGEKIYEREDGRLMRQSFSLREKEIIRWFDSEFATQDEKDCWNKRETFSKVFRLEKSGKGYIGGHNTANRMGWETTYPNTPNDAIIWWDDTEMGSFTGYYPGIVCLKMVSE